MGKVLELLQASTAKGQLLEKVLERVLPDLGFQQVRRQMSGVQFGFDISAIRMSEADAREEVWKFECKNLRGPVTVTHIAPKLIWNYTRSIIDRFVIVSVNDISNDLDHLLSGHTFSMPITIWSGEKLEKAIRSSPSAMELLGLPSGPEQRPNLAELEATQYPPRAILFDVFDELDPPFRFDYWFRGNEITKAYTGSGFRLVAIITNNSERDLDIHSLEAITLEHEHISSRVLRLAKMKGLYDPIEIRFRPSTVAGASSNILGSQIWRIKARNQEPIRLNFQEDLEPGFYHIMFRARGKSGGGPVDLYSPSFPVNVRDPREDVLVLHVMKHYDSAAPHVLNLDQATWNSLKAETASKNKMLFLGPSLVDIPRRIKDSTWLIREVLGTPSTGNDQGISIPFNQPSKVLIDLGVSVEEELYSLNNAFQRVFGADPSRKLLPEQIAKRKTTNYRKRLKQS
jgi:hypothetical protein